MKKSQLKKIIKECLLEILAEGIGQDVYNVSESAPKRRVAAAPRQVEQKFKPSHALNQAVIESAGGDPIMEGILADTAATTLPSMMSGDKNKNVVTEQVKGNLDDVFGNDATDKWAKLAFGTNSTSTHPPPVESKIPDHVLDAPARVQ